MEVSSWKSESMAVYALGSQQAIHLIHEYWVVHGYGKVDMPWVARAGHPAKVTCRTPGLHWLDSGRVSGSIDSVVQEEKPCGKSEVIAYGKSFIDPRAGS